MTAERIGPILHVGLLFVDGRRGGRAEGREGEWRSVYELSESVTEILQLILLIVSSSHKLQWH